MRSAGLSDETDATEDCELPLSPGAILVPESESSVFEMLSGTSDKGPPSIESCRGRVVGDSSTGYMLLRVLRDLKKAVDIGIERKRSNVGIGGADIPLEEG